MQITKSVRSELLDYIDKNLFDAILRLPSDTYRGKDKENFERIIQEVDDKRQRFHQLKTAAEIKENFLKELSTESVQNSSGRAQHFPEILLLPQLKEDFIKLCKELNI